MLTRLSLLKKFIVGFAMILILLVALAIVGYRGLSGVVEHTRVSDSINAIGAILNRARLHEQGFIISRTDENANTVHGALDEMKAEIDRAKNEISDEAIQHQLSAIRSRMIGYEQAFDAYVALVVAPSEKADQMSEKARFALDLTSRIRDREQTHLEEIRQNSQTVIAQKTAWVDAAAQIYNTALEARVSRVSLMSSNELSTMAQWKGTNKKLAGEVTQLRSQLQIPGTVQLADRILEHQQVYIGDVLGPLETMQYEDLNRMIKSVKDYTWSITSLQFELRQQLDFFLEDTQILIDEKLAVTRQVTTMANLLALNATIESARAGDAGKGFAVVANEIKDLARQTAEATKGIKQEIEGIQTSTAETVSDISRIADVIGEVDDIVSTIAAAVEEQTSVTAEIAENVAQASAGIAEVNANVAQSSTFSGEIASDIAEVNRIAGTLADNSANVSTNAGDLTRLAEDLQIMIGEFKVERSIDAGAVISDDHSVLVTWDDSIQFGIDAIDRQHHRLVDLVNNLHGAMRRRAGKTVMGPILESLAEYAVQHFEEEEQLMEKAGYADVDDHKRLHEKLVKQVMDFKIQFESGSATVTMDLMRFLSDWLVNHINGVDRKYVHALKGQL